MNRCSTPLIVREMQIRIITRYYFTPARMVILKRQKITSKNAGRVKQLYVVDQFSSVTQSCPTLCDPVNCSKPGFPVHHQLPEFTKSGHSLSNLTNLVHAW